MAAGISETRADALVKELLEIRGWKTAPPPKGHLLWKNEYKRFNHLAAIFSECSKTGAGAGFPDFLLVEASALTPLIVGENKGHEGDIGKAASEACDPYGDCCLEKGFKVLAAGVAGNERSNIGIVVNKWGPHGWEPVKFNQAPINWIPTPDETGRLLTDELLFDLKPVVPSPEILAEKADEINRILRECRVKDENRPAYTGAIMLALWETRGRVRAEKDFILQDINAACRQAFERANRPELAKSIYVDEHNTKLADRAWRLRHILSTLGIPALYGAHDYLGQLYETFFRYTGGNTIGQYFTPRHITRLMADLCKVGRNDLVVDPACGTGGFLIACMHRVSELHGISPQEAAQIVREQLRGFEDEPITAALCVANMILRGDGTTGIIKGDCFTDPRYQEGKAQVVLMNPPFPHKKTDEPATKFIDRALDALAQRGKLAVIVPASLLVKKGKEKAWRKKILRDHSLDAVFTLPDELFQPYASSTTAIAVMEKGIPHLATTPTFFCRIENDGLRLKKSVRVHCEGSQLQAVLDSYDRRASVPNFCVSTPLPEFEKGCEWAPGAYIEVAPIGDQELRNGLEFLIRSQVAFFVHFAPSITAMKKELETSSIPVKPYRELVPHRKKAKPVAGQAVGSLFDVYYGMKQLHNKEGLAPGNSLVISSSGADNGCYGFFDFIPLIEPPFATVQSTGSIGEAFVQTLPCGVTDDCLLLITKEGTPPEALYIAAAVVRHEKWRFNYGRKMTPDRIESFPVPVKEETIAWIRQRLAEAGRLQSDALEKLG